MTNINYSPPLPNELELSFIGPGAGYGETIIVHAGNNNWFTIDSCIDDDSGKPLSLIYFEQLGINLSGVKIIIASHWHDDHIKGLSQLLDKCPTAKFVITDACNTIQFKTLYSTYSTLPDFNSGISELLKISPFTNNNLDRYITAKVDTVIWKEIVDDKPFQISAISPSNYIANFARSELAKLIPSEGEHPVRIRSIKENSSSIALFLSFGDDKIILGADLENHLSINQGWKAVINDCILIQNQIASTFKVPHHGSLNAINYDFWTKHLINPISIITPYVNGRTVLPKTDELQYIQANSSSTYITSSIFSSHEKNRKFAVTKAIETLGLDIVEIQKSFGHVQMRKIINSTENWSIKLFGTALKYNLPAI